MDRKSRKERAPLVRLDLSNLETNDVLLEDLHKYVGLPKSYIPVVWDVCVRVLREESRIILSERDNGETMDQVYTDFYNSFDETKFRQIVQEHGISVRRDGFRENVAQFLYDVFMEIYSQVAGSVDKLMRQKRGGSLLNYRAEVVKTHYDYFNNGFGETEREVGVDVRIISENMLSAKLLNGDGYEF